MKVSEILAQTFGLVSAFPTQGANAKDKNGEVVPPLDPSACSYCALGALIKVTGNEKVGFSAAAGGTTGFNELTAAAVELLKGKDAYKWPAVPDVNDDFPELIPEMFRIAIAAAREKEACEVVG
jgi:hypothetical protein